MAKTGKEKRQRDIARAFTLLAPHAPFADAEAIREAAFAGKFRTLPPSIAVWLATIAHIRHVHTGYDRLLAEGYGRDAARFFVVDEINAVLTRWRTTRLLDPDEGETPISPLAGEMSAKPTEGGGDD